MKKIYLDNAATTKVDDKVVEAMVPYFSKNYGNASSQHFMGKKAKDALEKSRRTIAKSLNAKTDEIYFTSGGTESNNFILKGLWFWNQKNKTGKNHIITTKIEHDCVLNTCKWLETQGAEVTYLDVDEKGFVNKQQLRDSITDKTIVVSIIHGNNEIGTIQNLKELSEISKNQNKEVLFHTDACQSYTKTKIDVKKQNLDFVTLNSHKIHGPKGVGAIYIKEEFNEKITPLMHGGGHERGLRSGTENVSGAVGFAKAVKQADKKHVEKMNKLRDKLINELEKIPNVNLNGPRGEKRLCNNINVSFGNVEGEEMGGYLEREGICASTGSACSSHTLKTSHVLKAIGLEPLKANSSIRMSISKYTTEEEINYVVKKIKKSIKKLRSFSPF
ncbi:MAG TPA: cysteine desulfurase family protein [Candidatus Nanoarchaeia archaeon]|nr:cysteine desulfurase family protein [Candidatus Nanoarchaeia archaeon]